MYHAVGSTQQGPPGRGKTGGMGEGGDSHLQVLLLPREGVGESLCGLGSVLGHLGLDGVRDFLEHGADLLQEAPGLINVVELQTGLGGGVRVIGRAVTLGIYSQTVTGLSTPLPLHRDGTSWEENSGRQSSPQCARFPDKPSKL